MPSRRNRRPEAIPDCTQLDDGSQVVCGYRVRLVYVEISEEERRFREEQLDRVIAASILRTRRQRMPTAVRAESPRMQTKRRVAISRLSTSI